MENNIDPNISSNQQPKVNPEEIEQAIKNSAKRTGSSKLYCYDWLRDIKNIPATHNLVEVRFKNTRKDFYDNNTKLPLEVGDIVAVESSPGHDIGVISLTGELVLEQIHKVFGNKKPEAFPKIYRKAKPNDIEKWEEAKALEHKTMIKSRQIAKDLKLQMKIGDVEYQGDKTKAIFYYIADERVDFRELIKILAEQFRIRVEMRQIGARQEAGRIGGVGPCGRDLCCSSFISNFVSVSTNAARFQEISLNPQKLAGQCGKLKCCLNYELTSYMDARKDFPDTNVVLEMENVRATHSKTDVYKRTMWYFYKKDDIPQFLELQVEQINEIIAQNKKGVKPEIPDKISREVKSVEIVHDYNNVVGQESLTRFDSKNKKHKNKGNFQGNNPNRNQQNPNQQNNNNKNQQNNNPNRNPQNNNNPNRNQQNNNPNRNPQNPNQNPNPNPNPNPNQQNNKPKNNNNPQNSQNNAPQ